MGTIVVNITTYYYYCYLYQQNIKCRLFVRIQKRKH